MAAGKLIRRLLRRRFQLTVFSGLAGICLVAAVYMTAQVFFKLDELGTSATDNLQWTVAQLEVEQLKAIDALDRMDGDNPATIDEAHRRFNALYSRVVTLSRGRGFAEIWANNELSPNLKTIKAELTSILSVMDGPDDDLLAQRARLIDHLESLTPPIRQLSIAGVAIDAQQTNNERNALLGQLIRLTALVVLMMVGMISLLILLWRLFHLYRRRALENRKTLNRLTTILNTSQDAVLVVAPNGDIVDKNAAAIRMFGLAEATDGPPPNVRNVLFRRDDSGELAPLAGARLIQSCAQGPNRCANLMARAPNGDHFPVELSADMADRMGDEVCVSFIRDISRRVAAESEMQVARDNALAGERAKARFLAMISHEMRTPLHGILGTLDLLDETRLTKEQRRYARIMHGSGQQLLNQINDALEITQADGGTLRLRETVFNLDKLLKDLTTAERHNAEARNTTLEFLPPKQPLGHVSGDKGRVQQVLINLIANAIKFTENGTITLEATRHEGTSNDTSIVEIQVSDTGIGIGESDLPRIFDDYVRLGGEASEMVEGTGLGLGIARQLVTLMGGQIGVESVEGEGSLFWVWLPLPKAAKKPHRETVDPEKHGTARRSVLIAEDNSANRYVLAQMLEKDGHSVRAVADGAAAIAAAEIDAFDLILMDISMPGIGGLEAARRITQGTGPSCNARVLFLTAHINLETEIDAELHASGAEGILTKPLPRSELRAIVAGKQANTEPLRNPPAPDHPVLDDHVLKQLTEMIPPDRLTLTLQDFFAEADTLIAEAGDLLEQADFGTLADRLHKLAGSAAIIGATAMQSTLSRAEDACLSGRKDDIGAHLALLNDIWKVTRARLSAHHRAA
ncbi:ATP-binding protein [Roseovarius sp. MMSF_3281]|uniref:ATP-binding protein n=1 Tax=Roseovarius sp. MMSF_3281 TaxID=3046694 RepID=UPI00273EDB42|nr:ATP-binding protein [Roseovarius sp. MMSF_3281]